MKIKNILLSGGSGKRLWPLSRSLYPKQFLKLFNHKSLFELSFKLMRQSGMGINQVVNQILRDKSKIAPIVVIREGSRVFISPNTDIFFPIPRENEVIAEFLK
ncbi:sugar phosphate nucleotidyltransferase [Helicobacter pylori]